MTWKEFKDEVEKQGVEDDDIICYIDMDCSVKVDWDTREGPPRRFTVLG